MNADRAQLIKQLFEKAGEIPGKQRLQFLVDQCGEDMALRAAVERLLIADDAGDTGFLGNQHPSPWEAEFPAQIGRFRLIRMIGEGGMGIVYEAEQENPQRRVALKLMRPGVSSRSLLRRFRHEAELLGQLQHPGIACIYEAGIAEVGASEGLVAQQPFFAMELVRGEPLNSFVAKRMLTTKQRLELMVRLCDAVHHAHSRNILHRDLKPGNILVDEQGQPKVLDFGIARLTNSDVQAMTMQTDVGQVVGTIPYMSPEQVVGDSRQLDARSDVYSLGVILHELLSGKLPLDVHNRSIPEAARIIREDEPSRLSSMDSHFRGDIETVVAKALEKDRSRRYQSAAELSDDIRRYLTDEPISARPASRLYQWGKFAKRNKGLVGGVAAAFVILLIAVAGVSLALVRATRAEHAAVRSAAKATAVSKFLQNMLAGVDPEDIGPDALTVREVLDHAATRLERELVDQPEVAASVHQTLGNHYSTLGHYAKADRHLRKAVDLRRTFTAGDNPELAEALTFLAANLQDKRDIADAEAPTREALDMRRRLFGQDSLEVAESLHEMASIYIETRRSREAEPYARASLDIRRRLLGTEHVAVALSTGTLGGSLMELGRLEEAETALRDAVEMVRRLPGDNESMLAGRLTFLARVLRARGKYAQEEAAVREAIAIRSRRLAPDHPALAWNLYCLAQVRWRLGDLEEAESACRKALDIYTKKRGPQHEDIAECQQLMAQIYDDRGQYVEAEPVWIACLRMRRNVLPAEDPKIAFTENSLIKNRVAQSRVFRTPGEAKGP